MSRSPWQRASGAPAFVIDDTEVHEVLAANSAVRIPIELTPGSYRYWCDVPGHDAMEGTLHVR